MEGQAGLDFDHMNYQQRVLNVCLLIGKMLAESGGETYRVENTMYLIAQKAGFETVCYATPTSVFIALNGVAQTQLRSIAGVNINLEKVERLNRLSRHFVAGECTLEDLITKVDEIEEHTIQFPLSLECFGAGLVSLAPMLLFQTPAESLILAFFVGAFGFFISRKIVRFVELKYIHQFVASFAIALAVTGIQALVPTIDANSIVIGALMPLVPGVAITNSFRDLIEGHLLSGIGRLIDAAITAGAIGAGVAIVMSIGQL